MRSQRRRTGLIALCCLHATHYAGTQTEGLTLPPATFQAVYITLPVYNSLRIDSRGESSAIAETTNSDILALGPGDRHHGYPRWPAKLNVVDSELAQEERNSHQVSEVRSGELGAQWISHTRPGQAEGLSQESGTGSIPQAPAPRHPEAEFAQTAERRHRIYDGAEFDRKPEVMDKSEEFTLKGMNMGTVTEQGHPLIGVVAELKSERDASAGSKEGPSTRKDEFDALRDHLAIFKQAAIRKNTGAKFFWREGWKQFVKSFTGKDKLLVDIEKLQGIHKLLPASERDRFFKLADKNVVMAPLGPLEPLDPLERKSIPNPTSKGQDHKPVGELNPSNLRLDSYTGSRGSLAIMPSPAFLEPGKLTGDVLDEVRKKVTSDWLKSLNQLLHEIIPLEDGLRIIATNAGNIEALLLQHFVFRTIELIHKHELISSEQVMKFLEMPGTTFVAAEMIYEWRFLLHLDRNGYGRCLPPFHFSTRFTNIIEKGIKKMSPTQDLSGRSVFHPQHYFYADVWFIN
ncbi:hypothetical protein H4Q26_005300 [Puccinia striiformis f. sp. tritici PST-130]|nr:hypothetical protein H4Q26_005300 [Puccinia striiformis f. sp. tritici PST-130]